MCCVHALAAHKRTSLGTPPRAAERSTVAAAAIVAAPRTAAMEPWLPAALEVKIERPVRLGVSSGEHMDVGLAVR